MSVNYETQSQPMASLKFALKDVDVKRNKMMWLIVMPYSTQVPCVAVKTFDKVESIQ